MMYLKFKKKTAAGINVRACGKICIWHGLVRTDFRHYYIITYTENKGVIELVNISLLHVNEIKFNAVSIWCCMDQTRNRPSMMANDITHLQKLNIALFSNLGPFIQNLKYCRAALSYVKYSNDWFMREDSLFKQKSIKKCTFNCLAE